jgi:hypothetical protein
MTAMVARIFAAGLGLAFVTLLVAGCGSSPANSSEREWARAECRQVIDGDARNKCMERVDKEYGTRP